MQQWDRIETFDPIPVKPVVSEPSRQDEAYQIFPARVWRVDYERKVATVKDQRNQQVFDVVSFPANSSSPSATDTDIPEEGTSCYCATIEWNRGSRRCAIIAYSTGDTITGQDAVAQRPITDSDTPIPKWTQRSRGVYRKAYPGQHTVVKSEGFTSKEGAGWDRASADLSRDVVDPYRRTHTLSSGRFIRRTDTSLEFNGFVHRPDASKDDIQPHTLPDGTQEWTLYLDYQQKDYKTRYFNNQKDMLPLVERVEKVQEFGLDYPVPHEIYETDYWDTLLGTVQPYPTDDKDWWKRTELLTKGQVQYDDETLMAEQKWDHPKDTSKYPGIGPSLKEGKTPRRRGWIIERAEGNVVGSNKFDTTTYGKILKPVLFPLTKEGRFACDAESGYTPITKYPEQVEARFAAAVHSTRFPYEYNTTRWDVTKEGLVQIEIGSTIPREKIVWDNPNYEHPHGAGRSLEAHLVGSATMVIGKNREEEESLDLRTMGGVVVRLGADDASVPDFRRKVKTQIRGKKDKVDQRELQYWDKAHVKLQPGDAGDLENKTGAENVSLRSAMDGGLVLRLGARDAASKRKHFYNGYEDGPGVKRFAVDDAGRKDARTKGRPVYGVGDDKYRFHDLSKVGAPQLPNNPAPYVWSGSPGDPDKLGLSADIHCVRDFMLRAGSNNGAEKGVSGSLDFAGALLAAIGVDQYDRSVVAALDGGVEVTVGPNKQGKALRLELNGDVDLTINGNLHLNVTGDMVGEYARRLSMPKFLNVERTLVSQVFAGVMATTEAPEIVHNQGLYQSEPEDTF